MVRRHLLTDQSREILFWFLVQRFPNVAKGRVKKKKSVKQRLIK